MGWKDWSPLIKGLVIGIIFVIINIISFNFIGSLFYELSNLLYALVLFGPICAGQACLIVPFLIGSFWLFLLGFLIAWRSYKASSKTKGISIGVLYFLVIFIVVLALVITPQALYSYIRDKSVAEEPTEFMILLDETVKKVSTYTEGNGEFVYSRYFNFDVDEKEDTITTTFNTRYNLYEDKSIGPIDFSVEITPLKSQRIYNKGFSRGIFHHLRLDYTGLYELNYVPPTRLVEGCRYIKNNGTENNLPLIAISYC